MYAVYDLRNKEQCVGIFNRVKDVAKYFGIKTESIYNGQYKGCLIKHRYILIKIDDEDIKD